jgi:hypothetical protein
MIQSAAILIWAITIAGIAVVPSLASAGEANCGWFGFDAGAQAEILDYRYGSSGLRGTYSEPGNPVPREVGFFDADLLGKGDKLFVRWKNKATGKDFREYVVLKGHLPDHDQTTCTLFFAIKQDQLYVFVITQELRPRDFPIVDTNPQPIVTDVVKVYIVYPYGKSGVD